MKDRFLHQRPPKGYTAYDDENENDKEIDLTLGQRVITIVVVGGTWLLFGAIVLAIITALATKYVNAPFEPLAEWQTRHIENDTPPDGWRLGEWINYKANHPQAAKTYIHDSWKQAKAKHANDNIKRLLSFLKHKSKPWHKITVPAFTVLSNGGIINYHYPLTIDADGHVQSIPVWPEASQLSQLTQGLRETFANKQAFVDWLNNPDIAPQENISVLESLEGYESETGLPDYWLREAIAKVEAAKGLY